jgi:hypothetical protein
MIKNKIMKYTMIITGILISINGVLIYNFFKLITMI